MIVDCIHWRDCGKRDGGCCALLNRSISRGVCRHCKHRTGEPPPASPNLGDPQPDAVWERGCGCEAPRAHPFGHRFEAEDESQAWPQLHAAIREARKAYQADGTMPDWDGLATNAHDQRVALAAEALASPSPTN